MINRKEFLKRMATAGASLMVVPWFFSGCEQKPYQPTWESLKTHKVPEWFNDAKFGIFIHWGFYSVPAYKSEWYPHYMYTKGSEIYEYHKKTYGPPWKFGYKDFIPDFTAQKWEPKQWAKLFKDAGAKYVVPVAEHHDGFAMWDSDLTRWNAAKMGPQRDIIGELGRTVRDEGMKFAPSYHRAHDWQYYENAYKLPEKTDTEDPEFAGINGLYPTPHNPGDEPSTAFLENWQKRWQEIQQKYQPDFAWFDFGWGDPVFHDYMKQMMADYYNKARDWGKEVAFNNKTIRTPPMAPKEVGDFIGLDHKIMDSIQTRKWQCPTYMGGGSWGYNKAARPEDFKSANALIDEFVDVVSKNGNFLLDIGPKADGTIPNYMEERLRKIGQWLEINGEAIYNTRPWKVYGEGPSVQNEGKEKNTPNNALLTGRDIRFTQSKNGEKLYALVMDWPVDRKITIESLKDTNIKNVALLGHGKVHSKQLSDEGLFVQFPDRKPCDFAFTLKMDLV